MTDTSADSNNNTHKQNGDKESNEGNYIRYQCVCCGKEFTNSEVAKGHVTLSADEDHPGQAVRVNRTDSLVGISEDGSTESIPLSEPYDGQEITEGDLPAKFSKRCRILLSEVLSKVPTEMHDSVESANERIELSDGAPFTPTEALKVLENLLRIDGRDKLKESVTSLGSSRTAGENSLSDTSGGCEGTVVEPADSDTTLQSEYCLDETDEQLASAVAILDEVSLEDIVVMTGISAEVAKSRLEEQEGLFKQIHRSPEQFPSVVDTERFTHPKKIEYENRSELQQKIITEIAKNPYREYPYSNKKIREKVGCGSGYVTHVKNEYGDLIEWKTQNIKPANISARDADIGPVRRELQQLTEKRRRIVLELAKEPNPHNPNRTLKEISEVVDSSPAYISDVRREYGELAERITQNLLDSIHTDNSGSNESDESEFSQLPDDSPVYSTGEVKTREQSSPADGDEESHPLSELVEDDSAAQAGDCLESRISGLAGELRTLARLSKEIPQGQDNSNGSSGVITEEMVRQYIRDRSDKLFS